MALYHLTVSQIRRSAGQSAIAAAAYRAGERLYSEYYGEYSDYTRKGGVICSQIILPSHATPEYQDRATLWNTVEQVEKHKKAQLAYSFDIALQNELSMEENIALAREFVQRCLVDKGMIADFAVHFPDKEDGGIPNPHFHVMTTMRPINSDGTWGQKQRREYVLDDEENRVLDKAGKPVFNAVPTTDWGSPETLEEWREAWCRIVNEKFAENGLDVRIDHRSYVRQGLDMIPTVHEGPTARQMEAKGIRTDKGELNRWIKATNRLMLDIKKKIKSLSHWISEVKEELSKPRTPSLADLLISYYQDRNAGAWSKKARGKNLKEFSDTVNYLTENKILSLEELESRLSAVRTEFHALSDSMKEKSARMKELQELIRQGENYKRLKSVHDELNGIKWKRQRERFETSHEADLRLFYTARRILKENLGGKPVPLNAWKQEYDRLKREYAELSPQYKPLREDLMKMRRVQYHLGRVLERRKPVQEPPKKKRDMEL
ncbi:MobQ family relaxase [Enterocloster bolteae]|uniref:MobQ family relaxase n=1 Tax=Enterocloster bolteae TaxID=208479 RepID=UPI0028DC48C3|nr:MobQ family relaxase [Enterocloster bolteae]